MQSTSVDSKEEGMKVTEQDTQIKLILKMGYVGIPFVYIMKRSSQFKKLMTDYCDRYSREVNSVMFKSARGFIEEEKTPNELHMKDGDIIYTNRRSGQNIKLKIKGQDGYEASFEMHFNCRLEKLMDFYCRKYCLEVTEVAFLFNGCLLRADQTPEKLHMWFEDEIYAVFYDQIAHIELKQKSQMATNVDNSDSKLWPDLETKNFISVVCRLTVGKWPNDVFDEIPSRLDSSTNRTYTKEQLKEKMHRLQAMYREFNSLLQNTEFKWNAETNTFSASAEVWQNYLQAHDKTAQFQKKGCDHYKLLEIIFNKDNANGVFHHSDDDIQEVIRHSDDDIQEVERITHNGKRKIRVKNHKYRKRSAPRQKGDTHPTLTEPSMTIAKSNKGRSLEATSPHVTLDCSITKCVAALEKIEDISDDIYVKALDKDIHLTLKRRSGNTFVYTMNRSNQFKKLMTDYCDHNSREFKSVIFTFGGCFIHAEQTPNELHMTDGDIIITDFRFCEHIDIKVKGQDGYEVSFTMDLHSRLENLMDFYCRKHCFEATEIAFLFNGHLLRPDQTPYKLRMCQGDEIYAVFCDQIALIKLKQKSEMATNVDNSDSELWPDLETKAFINIMVRKVTYGNMSNDDEWDFMTSELNSITNRTYKKEQLKEKMHRLRATYREFNSLLQNPEFNWNVETNTFSASAEVWQNYLQAHDKTAQFHKKGCDYYYKWLETIFNKINENGGFQHSDDDIQEVERITRCSGKEKIQVKDQKYRKGSAPRRKGDTHPTSTEPSMARAKANKGKSLEATSPHVTLDYSITKCVAALEKMEDISNDIFVKALDKFHNPNWREMFIAMSNNRRRGWLGSL